MILPQMKEAIKNTLEAFWIRLEEIIGLNTGARNTIMNQFEMFGYDFMIDEDLNVLLIEVNTNPCLETSPCPLLNRLITQVLDQTFKIAVDPFFRGKEQLYGQSAELSMSEINYEMVFSNASIVQEYGVPKQAEFYDPRSPSKTTQMRSRAESAGSSYVGKSKQSKYTISKAQNRNKNSSKKRTKSNLASYKHSGAKRSNFDTENDYDDQDIAYRDCKQTAADIYSRAID